MTAVYTLVCTLPIFLTGDFWHQQIYIDQSVPIAERWSLALALGAGFVTLLHFGLSLLKIPQALTVTIAVTIIVGIIQLQRQKQFLQKWWQNAPFKSVTYANGAVLGFVLIFFYTVYAVSTQAGLGHDGYAFWGYKAKIIFSEGAWPQPVGRFATTPHADYPLLVSTMEAWTYRFLGGVNETAVKIIFVLFYAALVSLFYSTVRQKYGRLLSFLYTALMALTPQLAAVSALSGYADVPLMLYVWGAAIFCQRWLNKRSRHDLLLGGILAALAIWVKREGAIYYLINAGLIVSTMGWLAIHAKEKMLSAIALFLVPGLLIIAPWVIYLHWWKIPNSDFTTFTLSNIVLYASRLPIILALLAKQLFLAIERWGLLWWFFLLSLGLKGLRQEARWYLALLTILPIIALNSAFILSSWQPFTTHIAVSLERLILHTVPLAWYLIALQTTDLNQWLSSMVKQR